ncbi:MAG TPA: hypothetical protein VGR26_08505 [Acidimicrobiales bacterium]|nr:hypothetical protein [Acidimicrobiales bacterium]
MCGTSSIITRRWAGRSAYHRGERRGHERHRDPAHRRQPTHRQPAGSPLPLTSNLNYVANQTVPNLVVVKVGTDGKVSLRNNVGETHVVADVVAWYTEE